MYKELKYQLEKQSSYVNMGEEKKHMLTLFFNISKDLLA